MESFLSDTSSEDSCSPDVKLRAKGVAQFYASLYKNDMMADLKLVVGDKEIKVHGWVLMSKFLYRIPS